MKVREATEEDIPAIVELLKVSLGESLMPKSERYWRWKHVENPFGKSPVLLCLEADKLVGVRAFMRWEWIHQGQVYRAVRAVDTATHPEYQGKGIFRMLTLSLLDYCRQQGDHFVFNTPNLKSKPGYIKMGWQQAGKLPLRIGVHRPFRIIKNYITNVSHAAGAENNTVIHYLAHAKLPGLLDDHLKQTKNITTNVSASYLRWRYQDVPVAEYVVVADSTQDALEGLIIGRLKNSRMGREFRITDCFLRKENNGKDLLEKFTACRKQLGVDYTTISGAVSSQSKRIVNGLLLQGSLGPMVTVRSLAMQDLHAFIDFKQWSPSLGDLELF